jgi:hypothetical protein
MDAFKELIDPAELVWSALVKQRAELEPGSVTPQQLLDTLLEIWDDDDGDDGHE